MGGKEFERKRKRQKEEVSRPRSKTVKSTQPEKFGPRKERQTKGQETALATHHLYIKRDSDEDSLAGGIGN